MESTSINSVETKRSAWNMINPVWWFFAIKAIFTKGIWKTWEYDSREMSINLWSSICSWTGAGLVALAPTIKAFLGKVLATVVVAVGALKDFFI